MAKKKKKRSHRIYLLLSLATILLLFVILNFLHKREPEVEVKKETIPEEQPLPPPLKEIKYSIKKGMTFADIMSEHEVSAIEINKIREEAKPLYDLAQIKAGHEIRVFAAQEGNIQRIEYDIDNVNYLQLEREEENYTAEIKEFPYETETKMISGIIEDNLIAAVNDEGEEDFLALSLAEIFAWDIDFYTDLRQGDSFKIIFEKKYLRNTFSGYGNITAAEFTNQGKKYQAFRYMYPDTKKADFYGPDGNSLKKEFLKSPIPYSRITSRFSYSRLHPIWKVYRPHFGVDYAARVGTPVQATAEGTVTFAGWNGASGRMVKIRHKNAYETMYLHLRSYAKGIKKGAKVQSGQTIGYVGSSGEATGPHLDYRIKHRERYINPLAKRFNPTAPLRSEFLEDFKMKVEIYRLVLEDPLLLFSYFSHL